RGAPQHQVRLDSQLGGHRLSRVRRRHELRQLAWAPARTILGFMTDGYMEEHNAPPDIMRPPWNVTPPRSAVPVRDRGFAQAAPPAPAAPAPRQPAPADRPGARRRRRQ